jgi:TPR repeat protein
VPPLRGGLKRQVELILRQAQDDAAAVKIIVPFFIAAFLAMPLRAEDTVTPLPANENPAQAISPLADPTGIDELKRRADAGDADAQEKLGAAYFNGQIVRQDFAQAFAWILKSANQGSPDAGLGVAYLYLNGLGTPKNPEMAFSWYSRLAVKGVPRAEFCLAELYANGRGVVRDYAQAIAWYRRAAEAGDASARLALGNAYYRGITMPKDPKAAFEWFSRAADQGLATAQLATGEFYANGIGTGKDDAQAFALYQKAAIQGNVAAKTRLGIAYINGAGTPVDAKAGFTYLLTAAQTDGYAAYWVGCCYQRGAFVSRDPVLAYAWGLRAASMVHRDDIAQFLSYVGAHMKVTQALEARLMVPELNRLLQGYIQPSNMGCTFVKGKSSVISYENIGGLILIPVETRNKSRALLLFDTGADTSLLTTEFAARLPLFGNSYLPLGGIGASTDLGVISDKTDLGLPGMTLRNTRWILNRNFNLDGSLGVPLVGILGVDLVKNLVVRVNYVAHTIEFIAPRAFTPPGFNTTSLPMEVAQMRPIVKATVINNGVEGTGPFLVDSGSSAAISLTKSFQEGNPGLNIASLTVSGAAGEGGTMKLSTGICSSLVLGGLTLPNAQVDLNASNQGALTNIGGTIGGEIWRRFDVVYDFPHQRIYLQKNAEFAAPYNYATAGMHVVATGANYDTLTIHEILPGSPGEAAGFQTGDVIVKIDEVAESPPTLKTVYPLIHTPGTYHLTVRRGDATVPLVLELKDPRKEE